MWWIGNITVNAWQVLDRGQRIRARAASPKFLIRNTRIRDKFSSRVIYGFWDCPGCQTTGRRDARNRVGQKAHPQRWPSDRLGQLIDRQNWNFV